MPNMLQSTATLAAVCSDHTAGVDLKICSLVARLTKQGYRIGGVLQKPLSGTGTGCNAKLFSIAGSEQYNISQKLGVGSSSCNLNTEALEQAAYDISQAITADTDLVVVNRFGKRETQGGGFRCVFERALELDVPVLSVVQRQWADSWLSYGAQSVTILEDDADYLSRWVHLKLATSPMRRVG